MSVIKLITNWLFSCHHKWSVVFYKEYNSYKYNPYKVCLNCGEERHYNTKTMELGELMAPYQHPVFDGTKYGWKKC